MKIKLNLDDNLHLNKILKLHNMTIGIRIAFEEDNNYNPQFFLDECLYELQMLEYHRIDVSEGIDVNKTNASNEYDTCHYWCFKDINFNNVAIVSVKGSDYRSHFLVH